MVIERSLGAVTWFPFEHGQGQLGLMGLKRLEGETALQRPPAERSEMPQHQNVVDRDGQRAWGEASVGDAGFHDSLEDLGDPSLPIE